MRSPTEREYQRQNDNILLKELIACFNQNYGRAAQGFRFNETIKLYCSYMRLLSGKLAYETFKANANLSVPSLRSIDRQIQKMKPSSVEGVVRSNELLQYLQNQNLLLVVNLSEDATRINGRVQYDIASNQIVGFAPPINEHGMPIPQSFPARSAAEIETYFYDMNNKERQPASLVNVVMAQPLAKGVPAFCILIFSTNGKYTALDVKNRWNYIVKELTKNGIKTAAISSDSDPRYNAAMKDMIHLGVCMPYCPKWFNSSFADVIPIQDTIHIGTKFRNRIVGRSLKFGKHVISMDHLKKLVKTVSKEQHKLSDETIKAKDRMNFDTVLKICDPVVINLLETHVANSEGTVLYLKVLDRILRSFLDLRLSVLDRIRFLWFAVFLLRIWKDHILKTKGSTLKKAFVSTNAYHCVEINAHGLVLFICFLKENNMDELFHPEMLGSQQGEGIFRQIRSLSSTFSTVTNASMMEIISKLAKIELINNITHYKLKDFKFPRIGKQSSSYYPVIDHNGRPVSNGTITLPSLPEIFESIELAKLQAEEYAASLGVNAVGKLACTSVIKPIQNKRASTSASLPTEIDRCTLNSENENMLRQFSSINLREYAVKLKETSNNCGLLVKVRNDKHQVFFISKHTLIWLLSKTCTKLSSDRLKRVMTRS